MASFYGGQDPYESIRGQFGFNQGINQTSSPKKKLLKVHVTDTTPHIVWTNELQYVILELMIDGTLLIITRFNDIIKVPESEYSIPTFDFRDYLVDERCFHLSSCDIKPKSQMVKGSTVGFHHPDECNPKDILEEYNLKAYNLMYGRPPKQIVRQVPQDLHLHTSKPHQFEFWNFDQPTKEFFDCWYHSTNKWSPNYQKTFYCIFDKCDIHLINQDGTFPPGPVLVRLPIPHRCGINKHLLKDQKLEIPMEEVCPILKEHHNVPSLPTIEISLRTYCHIFFTYKMCENVHDFKMHEMYSFMLDVISVRQRCWNLQSNRCRLDYDNKISEFWTTMSISDRLNILFKNPEQISNPSHEIQVMESQKHLKSNSTKHPHFWFADKGLSLLNEVLDNSECDEKPLNPIDLLNQEFHPVPDMDARSRGFTLYSEHGDLILFKNERYTNLICLGNRRINVYVDAFFNGQEITHAWRRFRPVIRTVFRDSFNDFRPVLTTIEYSRQPVELIPHTDMQVSRVKRRFIQTHVDTQFWTPIIIPCITGMCKPPNTFKKYLALDTPNGRPIGVKRLYTMTNSHFNKIIKHNVSKTCDISNEFKWKLGREGPIPILVCSRILDSQNNIDFKKLQDGLEGPDPTLDFVTFSPNDGLHGFTEMSVRTSPPKKEPSKFGPNEDEMVTPILWSCCPNCIPPSTFQEVKVENTEEYKKWILQICMNADKLRYENNYDTFEPCTASRTATWRKLSYFNFKFPAFFCSNFAFLGLNYHLPMDHPKRWTMAYQFTCSELDTLAWKTNGYALRAYLPDATVVRPFPGAPQYSIIRTSDNQICHFSTLRFGVGEPDHAALNDFPVVYESRFEADTMMMSRFLKFQEKSHRVATLGDIALRFIGMTPEDKDVFNKTLMRMCTGMELDPNSELYKETANYMATQFALMDFGLEIEKPKTPKQTLGAEGSPQEDTKTVWWPTHAQELRPLTPPQGTEDTTLALSPDTSKDDPDATLKPRKGFMQIFNKKQ